MRAGTSRNHEIRICTNIDCVFLLCKLHKWNNAKLTDEISRATQKDSAWESMLEKSRRYVEGYTAGMRFAFVQNNIISVFTWDGKVYHSEEEVPHEYKSKVLLVGVYSDDTSVKFYG